MDTRQQRELFARLKGQGYDVNDVGNRRHVRKKGRLYSVLPGRGRTERHAWDNALHCLRASTGLDFRPTAGKGKKTRA